jgi:hypothetical protein
MDIVILRLSSTAAVSSHPLPPSEGGIPRDDDDPSSLEEVVE